MTYERPNIMRMDGYSWGEQPEQEDSIKLNTIGPIVVPSEFTPPAKFNL